MTPRFVTVVAHPRPVAAGIFFHFHWQAMPSFELRLSEGWRKSYEALETRLAQKGASDGRREA